MTASNKYYSFNNWNVPPRYSLKKIIGSGAYGVVMLAFDNQLNCQVAIKKIGQLFQNFEDSKRVFRELQILSTIKNKCIVPLIDAFKDINQLDTNFDTIYLVLEYYPADLYKLIHSSLYLNEENVRDISYNLLNAISFLHKNQIIHRDIKPGNILINENCNVKLCDFGLARSTKQVFISKKESSPQSLQLSPIVKQEKAKDISEAIVKTTKIQIDQNQNSDTKSLNEIVHNNEESQQINTQNDSTKCSEAYLNNEITQQKQQELISLPQHFTQHIVTRWYRPPEIILLEKNYSYPVDIWSFGCVFAELLMTMKQNLIYWKDRKPLFPGNSCFPLSPRAGVQNISKNKSNSSKIVLSRSKQDQLALILKLIGTPKDEQQFDFISDQNAQKYIKSFSQIEPIQFSQLFPGSSEEIIEVLEHTLCFDPGLRYTANQLLNLPFFTQQNKKNINEDTIFEDCDEICWDLYDASNIRKLFLEKLAIFKKK